MPVWDNALREYYFVGTMTNNGAGMAGDDGQQTDDGWKDRQIFRGKH